MVRPSSKVTFTSTGPDNTDVTARFCWRASSVRPRSVSGPGRVARAIGDNGRVAPAPREIVLLGSTGSIGTQAIDVIRRAPDRFRVVGLGAGGGNVALLAAQALELGVGVVGVARASVVQDLQLAF